MVAINKTIVREYQDGMSFPVDALTYAAERAYRRDFVEEARRIVRVWAHPPGPPPPPMLKPVSIGELMAKRRCDPFAEEEAMHKQRRRLRERYTVYGPGDAGPKTHHLGYRPGHEVPAARLRGRQHAMAYVTNIWKELRTSDLDIFDPKLLCPWLRAVEVWATKPLRRNRNSAPPRPLEVTPEFENLEEIPDYEDYEPIVASAPSSAQKNLVALPPQPLLPSPSPALPSPPPSPHSRIRLTRVDQIEVHPPRWLLRGILERDTFALIFGDPGCGKSFLAIDWACRIATGTPWREHPVKGGPVVYVAGEGQQGFGRRIRAWSEHHNISLQNVPLYMAPSVAIPDIPDLISLINAIDTGIATVGPPVMIVLDTLARCFGGGDENSTQDMSKFVTACDAIRYRYDCTILVVHHSGHSDKSRARGAIALKAALDAEYRLENENGLLLTATKMKDAEMPPPLAMKLASVELPDMTDEDGNVVTSAVIETLDPDTSAIVAKAKATMSGKWQKTGLELAHRLAKQGQVTIEAWRDACAAIGMTRQTQSRVLQTLTDRNELIVTGELLSPPN